MLQHSFEIYSRRVELSVHDNVLLVHQLDTSTVLLLDVRARSNGPIANPLPLAIAADEQGVPADAPAASSQQHAEQEGSAEGRAEGRASLSASASTASSATSDGPDHLEGTCWSFQPPNLVFHLAAGKVWTCEVGIAAVAATCSDWPVILAFLQRRQASLHPGCDIKAMLLSIVKNALLEQLNMRSIRQIFDTVASGYAEACAAKTGNSGTPASPDSRGRAVRLAMPALSPQDVEMKVLRWLHSEEATGVQYLEAAVAEYLGSCGRHGVAVPAGLHLLAVDVALLTGHPHQVVAMLQQQARRWDSADLASHLERLARKGDLPQGWQLALDMYTKLGLHDRQCQMLLNKGKVLQALQCAQRHQLKSVAPDTFLSKAAETGDLLVFTAVYRVCYQTTQPRIEQYSALLKRFDTSLHPCVADQTQQTRLVSC